MLNYYSKRSSTAFRFRIIKKISWILVRGEEIFDNASVMISAGNQFIDFLPARITGPSVIVLTGSPPRPRVPPSLGFSISHNVRAWSIGVLEKRGRDKIAHGPIPGEFTLGISLPYIWASTGNATILSGPGSWRSIREMLSPASILPVSPGTWRVGKAATFRPRNAVINWPP